MYKMNTEWGVDIQLYPHQKNAVMMMERLEKERCVETSLVKNITSVGIFGDTVGSGKTLSMVSLLSRANSKEGVALLENYNTIINKETRIVRKLFNSIDLNNEYFLKIKKYKQQCYYLDINVIVVSPLTLTHWTRELMHSNLKCLYVYKESDLSSYDETYDVIVVTYNKYNNFVNYLSLIYKDEIARIGDLFVKRMIIDEIIFIQNMLKLDADFFWIITTRFNICNIYTESQMSRCFLKRLLASINISSVVIKNSIEQIKKSYVLPNINEVVYECFSMYSDLKSEFFSEEVKKMIAADDLQSAIEHLGGHLTDNQNLHSIILQKELDIQKRYEAKIKYYSELNDEKKLKNYNLRLNNKIASISQLENRIKNLSNECPICMEPIEHVKIIVGCCTNVFCEQCILEILKSNSKCALCRKFLDPSNMIYSKVKERTEPKATIKKTKVKQLLEIIKSNLNGKYVVFSEYNNTFDIIYEELKKNDIIASELKGTVDRINTILRQFANGKINVLLLNSRNDGSGINLQNCTDIIIYHKMEKILEEQIVGRAYRLGRTMDINVHRLLHNNE